MRSLTNSEELESEEDLEDERNLTEELDRQDTDEGDVTAASVCGELGKRQCNKTQSEELWAEQRATRHEIKRTRTRLREYHERRSPRYLDDYVMNAVQSTARVLDRIGRPIRENEVKIPRNRREAHRSKFSDLWCEVELKGLASIRARGVLEEITFEEVPKGDKPIRTRWVYGISSDQQGYVLRFKARLVALGNYQGPGICFLDTLSSAEFETLQRGHQYSVSECNPWYSAVREIDRRISV